MRVVTWNVNSLNARREYVELYLDAETPDVLCLQELKLDEESVPVEIFTDRGYQVAMLAQKQWNGVLIASRAPLEAVERGLPVADEGEARLVSATTAGLRVVNLYCPQGQRVDSPKFPYKLRFYDALIDWLAERLADGRPTLVLGDLNVAPTADDVWSPEALAGVPSFHPEEHARWARLEALGLHDAVRPHVPPGTFSFWDYRGGDFRFNKGMRIDHVLVTAPLLERVTGAAIQRPWRKKREGLTASDHAPVLIELAE